jgi:hypothetical protein
MHQYKFCNSKILNKIEEENKFRYSTYFRDSKLMLDSPSIISELLTEIKRLDSYIFQILKEIEK